MSGSTPEQGKKQGAVDVNTFEDAKGRFNRSLLSGTEFNPEEILPALQAMTVSIGVGVEPHDSVRLGGRYSILALVNGQAADVAEQSGESVMAGRLRSVAEGYQNMAELLSPSAESGELLPAGSDMKGAKSQAGGR